MKKQLLLFISLLLPLVANADAVEIDGIYYNLISEGQQAEVTSKPSGDYSGAITIPESVEYDGVTYSVTSIGGGAFYKCYRLTSIEIPNSVTSIGVNAFFRCSGLTSVIIPNSVTSIGDCAFYGCSSLTSITIPNSVTSIGYNAFDETPWYDNQPDGLVYAGKVAYKYKGTMPDNTNITIKKGTLGIAWGAFSECSGLTSITIPNSVTSIGSEAFYGCSGLTAIEIPNSVTSIGGYAFQGCSGLTSVTIGNSVTSIGREAFRGCSGLTSVTIGNSVTSIGREAFRGCSGLTSIEIPNSVTSIGDGAFYNCTGLTSVTIGNSVTSIGGYAFQGCSGLTSITIPNSVTSIGGWAFYNCSGLTSISVENGNPKYDTRDNCNAIIETSSNTLIAGCKTSIIPNSVESIGDYAFSYCTGLTSIEIPNSVTSIGDYAFSYCTGLTSIEIPNSVTSIGIFAFSGCSRLASVTVELESPLTIDYSTFSNRANATLYVPYGSTAAYEAANYWKEFKEIIEMPGPRCATPTISYKGGKLHFECETPDVTYHYTITPPSKTDNTGNDVEVGSSYTVQVYASKDGYQDSDIATQDIDIRGIKGDVDGDGVVDVNDVQTTINIILKK